MPNLDQLTICAKTSEGSGVPTVQMIPFTGAPEVLNRVVAEYCAPVFCGHLADLKIEVRGCRRFWKSLHTCRPNPEDTNTLESRSSSGSKFGIKMDVIRPVYLFLRRVSRLDKPVNSDKRLVDSPPPVRQATLAYQTMGGDDDSNLQPRIFTRRSTNDGA